MTFNPDYTHIVDAVYNRPAKRIPLYEHIVSIDIIETIMGRKFAELYHGDQADRKEFFRMYCDFFRTMGYDTVSFECCIGQAMPGAGSLGGSKPGEIQCRDDFETYPWDKVHDLYFERFGDDFTPLAEVMPEGMKAVGGVGNGIFECIQEITGYQNLCILSFEDPDLYADLFKTVTKTNRSIWKTFLGRYAETFAFCRFGDDLGFKNSTLLAPDDICTHIIPGYKQIIDLVHSYNKPFLLHSCGNIFPVMDQIIDAGINAKHSNEDIIAPFSEWVERYGDQIGNFGGVDTDIICQPDTAKVRNYMEALFKCIDGRDGIALGTGNSIPDYTNVDAYCTMIDTVRSWRGE